MPDYARKQMAEDFARRAAAQHAGGQAPASQPAGLVCRNVGRELMHLLFVLKGAKSKALTNWPSFWNTFVNVLRIRKGDTFYNWRSDDQKVFLADCYCTMHDNLCRSRS